MKVTATALPGVVLVSPDLFRDERGSFHETYRADRYREAGIPDLFVQDNLSVSVRGALRGLHLQCPAEQAKLVQVLDGEIFDVAVDLRVGSPHFRDWVGLELSAEAAQQLYIPPGFAHGFCVLSDRALFAYKCSAAYDAVAELAVAWNDPAIGIRWPIASPLLSPKDAAASPLDAIDPGRLPRYSGDES